MDHFEWDPHQWLLLVYPGLAVGSILLIVGTVLYFKRRSFQKEIESEWQNIPESSDQTQKAPSYLQKLQQGLAKTRTRFELSFLGRVRIDEATLEKIHEHLYKADVGVKTADFLCDRIRHHLGRSTDEISWEKIAEHLRDEIRDSFVIDDPSQMGQSPYVILVVGVNGVGKTTTVAKLCAKFQKDGSSVLLAAADTFRAAAIDQLKVWGERLGVDVIAHREGSDPAAVAFDAAKAAKARHSDVLIIDTAGRLHNKKELMEELSKIKRSISKELPDAPHDVWLVIDATTGQNALLQAKAFSEAVDLSGFIVTKLDGTAKGGVLIGLAHQFRKPVRYIGIGEGMEDLQTFSAQDFADSLFSQDITD